MAVESASSSILELFTSFPHLDCIIGFKTQNSCNLSHLADVQIMTPQSEITYQLATGQERPNSKILFIRWRPTCIEINVKDDKQLIELSLYAAVDSTKNCWPIMQPRHEY